MLIGDADQDGSSKKANNKFLVRTDTCTHLSIMIYYLIDLAWALAVRRDTQGNQWNVQTCRTVCNERVRRTDAMMRCHRRYAIAMAHLFSVICNKPGAWSSGRECLRSEETHRTPSYLPISTIFHSATMGQCDHGPVDDVAAGSDSEKLRSAMTDELRLWGNHPAIGSEQKSYTTGRTVTLQ